MTTFQNLVRAGLRGIPMAALLTFTLGVRATAANVTLAWDPSTDATVTGYRLYYGTASRAYTGNVAVNAGTTSATVSNLAIGQTYYFAATSLSSAGQESAYSGEVSYMAPAANSAPVANAQSVSTPEDTARTITLSATDADGNPLSYAVVTGPAHGTLSGAAPNLTYTPAANYNGADSFTFKANDGTVDSAPATVSLAITPVNDAPVANGQNVTTAEDTARTITLTGSDVDGNALTYAVVAAPAHGTLSGTAPNLVYTPAANYNGSDSFTFRVNDGTVNSATATVSITVTPVNDAPVANAQSVSTPEDTAKAITLTGSDVDGNALTYAVVTGPAHGTLSGTAPNLVYTPAANYNGSDSFTFRVNDGSLNSANATVSLTVAPVNDAPVAMAQSVTTAEDTAKAITLNGSDVDGDALTYAVSTPPAHGTLSGTAPNLTYTPASSYSGSDSFAFRVNDGLTNSSPATVAITITAVNHAPVANAQTITTPEDTAKAITLTASDADGDSLTYTIVTPPAHGSLSGTAPNLTYTPATNYSGADSFWFKANDGTTDSALAVVSINITAVNHAPVANAQSVTTAEDTAKVIVLTATDADGNNLTYTVVTPPAHGSLSGIAPNLTYTPAANYNGADSFTFKANDGTVDSTVAAVALTVTPVNDAPVASAQSVSLTEDATKAITLSAADVDGDALSYTIVTPPAHGTLSGTAPNMVYTPATNYSGADSFWFKANDGTADSAAAVVSLNITAVNHAPVASAQSVTTPEDAAKAITLAATDVDGDTLSYTIVAPPAHGKLTGAAPNVIYTPTTNYNGSDSFTFKANDGTVDSSTVAVFVTVTPVNDAPVASAQTVTLAEDSSKAITLSATDVEGDALTYTIVTPPAHGTLSGTAPNVVYTPATNYSGADSFWFKANDGAADSGLAVVSLNITAVNHAPIASAQSATTLEDTATAITLAATDVDGDTLTYTIVTPPAHGTLSGTPPNVTYKPATNYNGADSFAFKANDGTVDSATAMVGLTVTPVNDPPTLNPIANVTVNQNASAATVSLAGISSGAANEAQTLTVTASSSNPGVVPTPGIAYMSPNATGSLTFTPVADASGTAVITVTVSDGQSENSTVTRSFTVTVNAVASPITLDPIASVSVDENSGTQTVPLSGISSTSTTTPYTTTTRIRTGKTSTKLTVTATSSDTSLIPTPVVSYSSPNSTGTLSFAPVAGKSGSAIITVTVTDGSNPPTSRSFMVTVNAVNAPPTLDPLGNLNVADDAGPQTVTLTGITAGPNESQSLTVTATSSNPSFVPTPKVNYTSPNTTGTLTFTPTTNTSGSTIITVTVNDGQPQNSTVTRAFTVNVYSGQMPPTVSLTSPSYGATFTAPAKISLAATVNPNGHTIAKVQFYADGTLVGEAASAPYAADWAATGVGAYNLTARVLYESNGSVDSQPVKVTLTTLPAPWETADLGSGIVAGDAVFTNGTFVVTGAGNIGGTADDFRYVYQTLSGDGDITVELKSAALSSPAGRVGVMIRESLANDAKAAFVGLDSNGTCHTIWRTATGGDSNDSTPAMKATSDLWVRLVRSGNRLTAYYSTNGRRWSGAGNQTISMASNIYIGLAVASGNTDTPVVANFGTPVVTP